MSARMQFPLSQRRHTNIAVIRYSKHGVKLEIACYKNKVISYRGGVEDRLDEVLQVDRIFTSVSKGHVASEKEIETVFGKDTSEQEAIKFMLLHGDLQVAQHERNAEVDEIYKDICLIIAQKCINTSTKRPFPPQVIEQALKSLGAGVKIDQPPKKQALQLIHQLIESQIIPIARAPMRVRCNLAPSSNGDGDASAVGNFESWCVEHEAVVEDKKEIEGQGVSFLLTIPPNLFKDLDQYVKEDMPNGSAVHVVEATVHDDGEVDLSRILAATDGNTAMAATNNNNNGGGSHANASTAKSGSVGDQGSSAGPRTHDNGSEKEEGNNKKKKGKKGKKSKGKGKRKGKNADTSSDDDGDDADDGNNRDHRKKNVDNDLAAELDQLQLGNKKGHLDDDDSDDGDPKKKGGKKNKKKNKNKNSNENNNNNGVHDDKEEAELDSDEELAAGNRKKRKQQKQHVDPSLDELNEMDEEDMDYGYDN